MSNSSIWSRDGPFHMLPLRAIVDLGAMAMKGYSAFPNTDGLLEDHH